MRTANQAASAILGIDLEGAVGAHFDESINDGVLFTQFLSAVKARLEEEQLDWREQIELPSDSGKRVLMCACTALPNDVGGAPGVVLVFDDITTLLQAQRDAAWGEVARRLAHEIKNPLTPIQLSAERMRRKFLGSMNADDAQILERATHTIVAQVEAMKQMVNAFSEYARAPDMHMARFDLNQLITEVADLYRAQESTAELALHLDPNLPQISVPIGAVSARSSTIWRPIPSRRSRARTVRASRSKLKPSRMVPNTWRRSSCPTTVRAFSATSSAPCSILMSQASPKARDWGWRS